ncbi:MAG: hypothetical protein ABI691_15035 [Ginsengibacter sp.]
MLQKYLTRKIASEPGGVFNSKPCQAPRRDVSELLTSLRKVFQWGDLNQKYFPENFVTNL